MIGEVGRRGRNSWESSFCLGPQVAWPGAAGRERYERARPAPEQKGSVTLRARRALRPGLAPRLLGTCAGGAGRQVALEAGEVAHVRTASSADAAPQPRSPPPFLPYFRQRDCRTPWPVRQ